VPGALAVGLATFSLLYGVFGIRRRLGISDRELIRVSTMSPLEYRSYQEHRRSVYERWLRPLVMLWGHRLRLRPVRVDRLFLIQAGVDPDRFDGLELRALKVGSSLLAGAALFVLGLGAPSLLVLLPLAAWSGYVAPTWYLAARRRARQDQIRRELPDLVGVLRSFITAGVPMERALHLISSQSAATHLEPNLLAGEIKIALGRYGLGATIEQALEELTQRVGVDEVTLFVGTLMQGKRLGTGMEQLLRDQELLVRTGQRNRATAEASRVSTKLMGVLAAVYLPEFVVLIMIPLFWGIIRRAFG
jgi:tight adherence protein C